MARQTDINFDAAAVEGTVGVRFASQVGAHRDGLAVVSENHAWGYAHLDAISNRIAGALIHTGAAAEPVALLMGHDAPLIAAMLASVKIGRPYLVLDRGQAPQQRDAIIKRSGATVVIVDTTHANAIACIPTIDVTPHLDGNPCEEPPRPALSPDAPLSITFTSGTTGLPKGVCHSHRGVLHHCRNYTRAARICPADRVSLVTPCHLAASMSSLWGALLNGATLFPLDLRAGAVGELPGWISRHRITLLHCVPSLFRTLGAIADGGGDALCSLRLVRLGGESSTMRDFEIFKQLTRPNCELMVAYSSTETGAASFMFLGHSSEPAGHRLPIGRPTDGMSIRLLDESGLPVRPGEVGRIVVGSRFLSLGYWRDAEQAAARFRPDPADPLARIFDTGDLARFRPDGHLEHCGRGDAQLKIRGHHVHPTEIEAALQAINGITDAAVLATQEPDVRLIAHLAGDIPADGELRRSLAQTLPPHAVPAEFVRHDKLPRTPGGKIDRLALANHRPAPSPTLNPPAEDRESLIATIWADALAKSHIQRHQDLFAELGADSLQAAIIVTRLERVLGRSIPIATLLQYPTVQSLAAHFAQAPAEAPQSPIVQVQPGVPGHTPLFFLHGDVYGGGLYCRPLAHLLGPEHPFYALAPLGFDAWPPPATIPEMASHFIRHIRAIQPAGPYRLAGFCNGGLVAYEIARQLRQTAERIDLLALIRARPEPSRYPGLRYFTRAVAGILSIPPSRRADLAARAEDHLRRFTSHPGLAARARHLAQVAQLARTRISRPPSADTPVPATGNRAHAVFTAHRRAMLQYDPDPYPGTVLCFWPAEESAALRGDPSAGWRRLAAQVVCFRLPGGHRTCLTRHADAFARHLRAYL